MVFDSSIRRLTKSVTSVLLLLSISLSTFADSPVTKTDSAVLHLTNGDHVTGTMINSTVDRSIGWQSPAFTSPFHFALGGIASIHFPVPAKLPQPEGDYCFELMGGDMVFGSLIALDDKKVVVHSPEVGRLNIDRNIIQRMYRWGGGSDQLFVGPNGLNGWQVGGEENSWREDAGQLVTDQAGAILRRDFGIPNQARFEFELSWKGQPFAPISLKSGKMKSSSNAKPKRKRMSPTCRKCWGNRDGFICRRFSTKLKDGCWSSRRTGIRWPILR